MFLHLVIKRRHVHQPGQTVDPVIHGIDLLFSKTVHHMVKVLFFFHIHNVNIEYCKIIFSMEKVPEIFYIPDISFFVLILYRT